MEETLIKLDYRQQNGVLQRVLLPHRDFPPEEGVPISLDLGRLYGHMPIDYVVKLTEALYNRGLVEPADFMKPGAAELTRAAILDVAKRDALDILSEAKRVLDQDG